MKYVRIKPTIVEAIQCFATSESIAQIEKFVGNSVKIVNSFRTPSVRVSTYPNLFKDDERCDAAFMKPGDYILRDEEGYFDTMAKDKFEEEFKEVSE
jgi:hypothetical protein